MLLSQAIARLEEIIKVEGDIQCFVYAEYDDQAEEPVISVYTNSVGKREAVIQALSDG